MKLRMALLTILVVGVVAGLTLRHQPPSSRSIAARTVSVSSSDSSPALVPPARDSALKLEVLRDRALMPYRLRPDRRVILALVEIRRLAGTRDSAVTAQFAAGRWILRCGGRELGRVSELPDFPELLDLLTEQARTQAWARGWSDNGGPERPDVTRALDRLDAPAAMREVDRAWASGGRDAALFRDAAHGAALLALETPDWARQSDAIAARSLAALAFARALGADDPKRETCMLAEVMGYHATARKLARSLPAKDPLRLFVSGDAAGLESAAAVVAPAPPPPVKRTRVATRARVAARTRATKPAEAPPASLEAPSLSLVAAAARGDDSWPARRANLERLGAPSSLVLGSVLRAQGTEASPETAEQLLDAMMPHSARRAPAHAAAPSGATSLAQYLKHIEMATAARSSLGRATWLDSDLARVQQRSALDAAVDVLARRSLETLDPNGLKRWFAGGSTKPRAVTWNSRVQRWDAHLADARAGHPSLAALRADADSLAPGPSEALRSEEALRRLLGPDDPTLRHLARALAQQMDTRPEDRARLATIAERDLGALTLAERLETSAAAEQGESDALAAAWGQRFESQADSSGASRRNATQGVRTSGAPADSILGSELAREHAAHPGRWEAARRYADWLQRRGDVAAARRVVERWMSRTQGDSSAVASTVAARTLLAHLQQLEDQPEKALQTMGDLYRSGDFAAVERTALILQDVGQSNQALAIAWAAHRRAPDWGAGRALLAELFWRQSNYGEAAAILRDGQSSLSAGDWADEIAPRFVDCFRNRQPDGLEAAAALMRAGFGDRATLGALAEGLGAAGLDGLAFELQARMKLAGADGFESSILAYGHLVRANGEAAALTWLRGHVADRDRDLLGILAYQEHHPELLWTMAPSRLQGELGDYHWLLRAATCMASGPSHPHYAETVNRIGRSGGTYHMEIARYLLGLREESEILAMAQTMRQRSEVCYFAGLKAEQRGHLRDAADWYFLSVESDTGNNIESRWASRRLRLWMGEPEAGAAVPAPPA